MSGSWPSDHRFSIVLGGAGPPDLDPGKPFREVAGELGRSRRPPASSITILQDHSRSILSHNDSPDLGFRWSANPYRGCVSACAYCVGSETQILMGDTRTKRIADLKVGDEIYGTAMNDRFRRYVRTHVLDVWTTIKYAYRIELSDGTDLVASGGHRFLSNRGWKHVIGSEHGRNTRPPLTTNNS